jgi:glutamate racemase
VDAPDAPIAVLASGFGGLAVCDAIAARLPKEDIVLLADHAYAPYARRKPAVVVDRVTRLAEQLLAERGPKVLVLASPQAAADVMPTLRDRLGAVPLVTLEGIVPQAAARSRTGRVALLTGDACLRGAQLARALKRERGGSMVTWAAVPGLREAVERRRAPAGLEQQVAALTAAGVDAIALGCPHASTLATEIKVAAGSEVAVVDSAALAAERVRRLLMRAGATTTRRRPGRRELISSDPAAAQAGLRA